MSSVKRQLRDIPFLILYLAFAILTVAIILFAFINGHPKKLFHPTESTGKVCGIDEYEDKPYLYYFDIRYCDFLSVFLPEFVRSKNIFCSTVKVCVKECPTILTRATLAHHICINGIEPSSSKDLREDIKKKYCARYIVPTLPVLHRCIPDIDKLADDYREHIDDEDEEEQPPSIVERSNFLMEVVALKLREESIMHDLKHLGYKNAAFLIMPFILTLAIIIIIGIAPYFILTLIYLISLLACLSCLVFFSIVYNDPHHKILEYPVPHEILKKIDKIISAKSSSVFLTLAIAFAVLCFILVIIGCCFGEGLRKACSCAKAASSSTVNMIMGIIPLLLSWAVQMSLVVLLVVSFLYLRSVSDKEYRFLVFRNKTFTMGKPCKPEDLASGKDNDCIFAGYYTKNLLVAAQIVMIFTFVWTYFLVHAFVTFQTAYAHYKYYWKRNINSFIGNILVALKAVRLSILYYFGSLAMGSLIMATVFLLLIIVEIIIRLFNLRKRQQAKILSRWATKILMIVETLTERLTNRAYIMIAVHGTGFCRSTIAVVGIFGRHPITTISVEALCFIVKFVGMFGVSIGTGIITHTILKVVKEISNPIHISCIYVVYSLVLTYILFTYYAVGILTIHYCACYDIDVNNGKDQPYHMPKAMAVAYGVHNLETK